MLPSSHVVPTKSAGPVRLESPRQLADAFSEFISASAQLEASYRDLQQEVAQLSGELARRNAELTRSIRENDRMRATLEQAIDSMPCGVLVLDRSETIVRMNPEGRRLLGPGSAQARTLAELAKVSSIDFARLAAEPDQHENEICLTANSSKRWLAIGRRELCPGFAEVTAASLRSIWTLRDVTAQKQAEQEREAARRTMALAEISTILAHEIRNPLASLELFAGLIADQSTGENAQWVAHLQAGIRTLSGTVNNVLSLNGAAPLRLALVNLGACMAGGVEFVQPIADQAGVALTLSAPEEIIIVHGNEDGMRQILLNLLRNAIRHTPGGGRVEVEIRRVQEEDGDRAIVAVRDTGCGIPAEAMDHLFEAGFSGTGETPGLGLAVCRQLMTQHGGAIRATSRLGQGSEFQLEFPAI